MLAVAYRGRPITVWDLMEDAYYGSCGKKLSNGATGPYLVNALVFSPNPSIGLLAASYSDGDLVLLDPFDDRTLERFRADSHTLAASPDGRTLVGADGFGTIQVYEFHTLRLLYRIESTTCSIKQLAFSKDNLHFLDIRGSQCNVWEPAVLIRDCAAEDSCKSTSVSATSVETTAPDHTVKISAMVLPPTGGFAFCGKDDGSVALYELQTGRQVRTLYRHKSQCLVRILAWWPGSSTLISVDASNTIFAWKLNLSQAEGWMAETILFQSRQDGGKSIIQVLAGHQSGKFILSTRESDHLWSIDGQREEARIYSTKSGIRKWIEHAQSSLHVICVEGAVARVYAWSDLTEVASISLSIDPTGLRMKRAVSCMSGRGILIESSEQDGAQNTRALYLFDPSSFNPDNNSKDVVLIPRSEYTALARRVSHVIGISKGKLIFLDLNSWVCSSDLESLDGSYLRHFFLPYDWFSSMRDVICALTVDDCAGNVVFVRNPHVAIIKGGLEIGEKVEAADVQSFLPVPGAEGETKKDLDLEDLEAKMSRGRLKD
jgi:WD40 repeat protein